MLCVCVVCVCGVCGVCVPGGGSFGRRIVVGVLCVLLLLLCARLASQALTLGTPTVQTLALLQRVIAEVRDGDTDDSSDDGVDSDRKDRRGDGADGSHALPSAATLRTLPADELSVLLIEQWEVLHSLRCPGLAAFHPLLSLVFAVVASEFTFVSTPLAELWQEMCQLERLQVQVRRVALARPAPPRLFFFFPFLVAEL